VSATDWHSANQRHLTAAIAVVAEALDAHVEGGGGQGARQELDRATEAMPSPAALDTLCATFGLSAFERSVLVLAAGAELEARVAARCASAHGDGQRAYATFGLALAALPDAHWSALAPAAPLRAWRLVELVGGESPTTSPLRIDERVLHHLTGVAYLDERLRGLVQPLATPGALVDSHRRLADQLTDILRASPPPLLQLVGDETASLRSVAAFACAQAALRPHVLSAADVPSAASEREALARVWEREALLTRGALLLELDGAEADTLRPALALASAVTTPLLVAAREPARIPHRPLVRIDVGRTTRTEQRSLWRSALGDFEHRLDGDLESLVLQFDFGLEALDSARTQFLETLARERDGPLAEALWNACRAQARSRLDDLAQRIEPSAGWDDLVLPERELEILRELGLHVRHRATVYGTWGFAAKSSRGLGLSALFAGASGTGKTMAAEVLANELRLDLYRIDLSQVVSKYIGETEKNLRRVFDTAEAGGSILLFDEADALFGKRTEVKDSHDRYANIEVSYLLQRMEAYRGLAILTTNRKEALDDAFLRRIRFVVQFPFPDAAQREEIWRRIFPKETPTEDLDETALARLNVAGGNIRNIALGATFLAAGDESAVGMGHVLRATRREYAKLERPLTAAETGGWS
jgi:ATPase family associated with various cellular activities (AAA)